MSDDLAERVGELEARVEYLERELDLSYDKERFRRQMERIFPNDADWEVVNAVGGHYSAEACLGPHEMDQVIGRVQGMDDYGWQIHESEEGEVIVRVAEGLIR
jgi:hypothetical protein